jgi:Pyruvate/2-oxoacid:ferredoxin oxidoreductase delta subunit
VLLAQETAAAKEEGESQAMLFAMLQEQHDKQIAAMTATNKANMDAMMERMNAILAGGGEKRTAQHDKDNPPPGRNRRPLTGTGTGTGTDQTKKPRKQKALCPHCKTFVLHKPDNCTELKANKDKRWPGWKSVHAIA